MRWILALLLIAAPLWADSMVAPAWKTSVAG